jgi:hypothetical protein
MPTFFPQTGSFSVLGGANVGFYIHEVDKGNDTKYYGFADHRGAWIIMREVTSTGVFRYANGKSDYSTNWTGRAGLSYDYYYNLS